MVAAIKFVATELDVVFAPDQADVVGELIAPHDGKARKEDLVPKIGKSRDIQADLAIGIGVDVKVGIVPLHTRFIQSSGAELVEP